MSEDGQLRMPPVRVRQQNRRRAAQMLRELEDVGFNSCADRRTASNIAGTSIVKRGRKEADQNIKYNWTRHAYLTCLRVVVTTHRPPSVCRSPSIILQGPVGEARSDTIRGGSVANGGDKASA